LSAPRKAGTSIDVVIPACNEEQVIGRTIEALFGGLTDPRYRIRLIVIDDGSEDRTSDVVKSFCDRYPITLVRLTRNFGKEAAVLAGLDRARGAATVVMDADLQHPIELIPVFLAHWEAGYQCVYGVREDRRSDGLVKRGFVRLFYSVLNAGSRFRVTPNAVDFAVLDRSAVRALCSLRERVRFTKGLYAWLGVRSIAVPFVPIERIDGESRFDARALLRLGWDGLTSFSDLPLRMSSALGVVVCIVALGYGGYIAIRTLLLGIDLPGWATLVDAVTFFGGLQLLFLGILGEYVRNVYIETKQRPNYLVGEVAGSDVERSIASRTPPLEADRAAAA
jgi:glycosyltransferase involved in cell wall biosynthesis